MKVVYYNLLKIDNVAVTASVATFEEQDNINDYVMRILVNCANAQVERKYKFDETLDTTKKRIEKLIRQQNVDEVALELGNRLAKVENDSNTANAHLKGKIPIGILLLALVDMETDGKDFKLMVIKSDYDEFIAENTGKLGTGLSMKNQIFKTCLFNVKMGEECFEWGQISTSDSTKRKAEYWCKTFLELIELLSDETNTINAYEQIKKFVLEPLRKNGYKADWFILSNYTIGYMRSEGTFDLDYFRNHIIGAIHPIDPRLDIEKLKEKVDKLREKGKFDAVFTKVPEVIKDKVKNVIKLTEEIDLKIKHEIAGMQNVIIPAELDDGRKGVTIVSENGYEYAKGLKV